MKSNMAPSLQLFEAPPEEWALLVLCLTNLTGSSSVVIYDATLPHSFALQLHVVTF